MSILVPIDLSDVSISALPTAVRLSEALDEGLVIVCVPDVAMRHALADFATVEHQDPIDILHSNVRSIADAVGVPCTTDIIGGRNAGEAIVRRAGQGDVTMVVMSSHGRTGLSRWRMGSVADHVVHHATVPVMVIPAPMRTGEDAAAATSPAASTA